MSSEMYNSARLEGIFKEFQTSRRSADEFSMEIVNGPNEVSPIILLRAYEAEPSVDNSIGLAVQLCQGKELRFYKGENLVFTTFYNGGDFGACFGQHPYLLDICLKYCYGIMLSKLTAPSND